MNSTPVAGRVSTIVAVYNLAPYIQAALRSVQVQQVADLEIVVVNDGSTDDTLEIVRKLAADDSRIRVIHQPNRGVAAARNAGIAAATGEFITFLDGDDLYIQSKLARQMEVMTGYPSVGLVFHDLCKFESNPEDRLPGHLRGANFLARVGDYFHPVAPQLHVGARDAYKVLIADYLGVWTCAVMFRRHLLLPGEQPFQEDLRVAEDVDLWYRLIRRTTVAYLDEPLALYRQHAASAMSSTPRRRFVLDDHRVRERHLLDLESQLIRAERRRHGKSIADWWFRLGYDCFRIGEVRKARRDYLRSFRARPRLRPLVSFLKSFVPQALVRTLRQR